MADFAISAVIRKAVDIAGDLIVEESSRLHWLPEDIRWLERQMRHIQACMDDAEAKKITNPQVATLIKDIRELAYDVEDIFDTFLPEIKSHSASGLLKRTINILPYNRICSKFSREIEKIKRRVQGIDEARRNFGVEDITAGVDQYNVDPRTTTLHFDDPIIVGFDQDIQYLMSKLERDRFVSIVGMPGLGKTTFAKKVFKAIKDGFDCSASVSVSQQVNIKGLLEDIATQIGLEKAKQEKNLEVNLYSFLQRKRYLLFLDDVWHTEAWDRLKEYFPVDSESEPFDYPTSWELFSKLIMPSGELENIGKQIVEKCAGVPLAIVVIAGMLRERGMNESGWDDVLKSIGQDASDKCSQILGLSYMDLPIALKPCFLYLGNFPEDYEFSASRLIRLWIAEKFVQGVGAREPEDVGEDYLSKLDARNLIQVVNRGHGGRVKKFRVHDLLQNLCVNMGRETDFLETVDHLQSSSADRVRRFSIHHNSIVGDDALNFNMRKIQIASEDLYLPTEIGSLSCLNYLELNSEWFLVIPWSIQNLINLQTLDLRKCFVVKLPIGIWKMQRLRHLYLGCYINGAHKCEFYYCLMQLWHRQVQVSLPNIQTLAIEIGFGLPPCMLLKFANLRKLWLGEVTPEIMEVLCRQEPISKKLEALHCSSNGFCMSTTVSLAQYSRLMKLKINGVYAPQPFELPHSLIKVTLNKTNLVGDSMETLKNLPKLMILELNFDSFNGSIMDCSGADSFPKLEVLQLYFLVNLEELVEGEGEDRGMPKLRQVDIKACCKLRNIPQRLQLLQMTN
ncbi:Apoptotic ATPase [Handroanthus impetiginosus]|uniref:Apoptotic ATPase n=1 Tax=Handroanthus impetiginosus TaxID=429701 RepID=A0A2G9HM53_9LAMI|nr:Apoptotic ATPase [Handroanthus impetiginosus]